MLSYCIITQRVLQTICGYFFKKPAIADGKENNNPFRKQANAALIASASLKKVLKTKTKSSALQYRQRLSFYYYLWIFFAFPIEQRRLYNNCTKKI